jgi:hypothetical protein
VTRIAFVKGVSIRLDWYQRIQRCAIIACITRIKMTLQEIKDQIAKDQHYSDWDWMESRAPFRTIDSIDKVAERYASESVKEYKGKAEGQSNQSD